MRKLIITLLIGVLIVFGYIHIRDQWQKLEKLKAIQANMDKHAIHKRASVSGQYRIGLISDWFYSGAGVNDWETVAFYLEYLINGTLQREKAKLPFTQVQVAYLGQPHLTLVQQLTQLPVYLESESIDCLIVIVTPDLFNGVDFNKVTVYDFYKSNFLERQEEDYQFLGSQYQSLVETLKLFRSSQFTKRKVDVFPVLAPIPGLSPTESQGIYYSLSKMLLAADFVPHIFKIYNYPDFKKETIGQGRYLSRSKLNQYLAARLTKAYMERGIRYER